MDSTRNGLKAWRILVQHLENLERAGVQQIGRIPQAAGGPVPEAHHAESRAGRQRATGSSRNAADTSPSVSPSVPSSVAPPPSLPLAPSSRATPAPSLLSLLSQPYPSGLPDTAGERQQLLDDVAALVRGCELCRELACTRRQTVFGVGHAQPRVVFFGEAPGADEDRLGEPFVGRAGQLLTRIIEACGWRRAEVYIMNVLKCRPPENRTPLPHEVENCRPFFERQFEILRPEYIVCVGMVPAQALLQTGDSVGKLRGRFYRYRDSKVLVTYHPSYLLRNPAAKKQVWEDMQMLLKEMGLPIPKRSST